MKAIRRMLDSVEPLFVKGGRFQSLHAIYEMVDTLFYSPPDVTRAGPHIRDAIDLKRVMIVVVFAATPAMLVGLWNTGFQANTALLAMGAEAPAGWREALISLLGAGHNPNSIYDNLMFGLVADDVLYLKVDAQSARLFEDLDLKPFEYVKNGKSIYYHPHCP